MYALVRQLSVKPGHTVTAHDREEAEAIAKTMRGQLGQLTIDIGEGRHIRIAVWASAAERATNTGSEAPAVRHADELLSWPFTPTVRTSQQIERESAGGRAWMNKAPGQQRNAAACGRCSPDAV